MILSLCVVVLTAWTLGDLHLRWSLIGSFFTTLLIGIFWQASWSAVDRTTYACAAVRHSQCITIRFFISNTNLRVAVWLFTIALITSLITVLGCLSRVLERQPVSLIVARDTSHA